MPILVGVAVLRTETGVGFENGDKVPRLVEVRQERVDVMCDEQRRHTARMNHAVDKVQQVALAPHVEI